MRNGIAGAVSDSPFLRSGSVFYLPGRFIRASFLTIFFAWAVAYVRADQIDNVVTNLPDGWNDNPSGSFIIMPQNASVEDVLQKVFEVWRLPDGGATNFTVLNTRQVGIPSGHFKGAHVYTHTAVLVDKGHDKVVVVLRNFDVYDSKAWSSAVFMERPPNSAQ